MKRDDILKMAAGPEMDAEINRVVFGRPTELKWTCWIIGKPSEVRLCPEEGVIYPDPDPDELASEIDKDESGSIYEPLWAWLNYEIGNWILCDKFSTTGDGMLTVIKRMSELGFRWDSSEIVGFSDIGAFRSIFWKFFRGGSYEKAAANGNNLPESTARAALLCFADPE